jgi:protein-arginine kinase activator protein McsA
MMETIHFFLSIPGIGKFLVPMPEGIDVVFQEFCASQEMTMEQVLEQCFHSFASYMLDVVEGKVSSCGTYQNECSICHSKLLSHRKPARDTFLLCADCYREAHNASDYDGFLERMRDIAQERYGFRPTGKLRISPFE